MTSCYYKIELFRIINQKRNSKSLFFLLSLNLLDLKSQKSIIQNLLSMFLYKTIFLNFQLQNII